MFFKMKYTNIYIAEYNEFFNITNNNNIIVISTISALPPEALEHEFIVLEVEARRTRAIPTTAIIIIEVIQPEVVNPLFSETYYRGVYTKDSELYFDEEIYLSQGYDETVNFELDGGKILCSYFSVIII
jgi:hypothetical protein